MRSPRQTGFSLIELLIAVAIILVLAAIAVPSMLRSRIAANEAAAVSGMRSITTAEIIYKINYPDIGYAPTLEQLGPGNPATPAHADLLTPELGAAPYQKSGYHFSATGNADSFIVTAGPISSYTGRRNFCTNTPAVLYYAQPGDVCVPGTSLTLQ